MSGGSARARPLLGDWRNTLASFVNITSKDYRAPCSHCRAGRDPAAVMARFE
jgi:hypothetical protein